MRMKSLILLAALLFSVSPTDEGDWVDPFRLPLDFTAHAFYAGYLNLTLTKAFYYVYTPSESNPSKDPLVAMISHGPGCSPLHSWLYTKGEFTFQKNTDKFHSTPNLNNWNKLANVLYIEGPAGVGFSVGPAENQTDTSITEDYFTALLRFYEKFSELKDQTLYLTGMQYAGITAPRIALSIIEHNRNPETPAWLRINLAGLLLLNPCTFGDECNHHLQFSRYTMEFMKNHYFVSKELYQEYETHCLIPNLECNAIKNRIQTAFKTTGSDIRNVYKVCVNQPGEYPCIDHIGIDAFLNAKDIKEDLNANMDATWSLCNADVEANFQRDGDGSLLVYETLLRREHNLRIWILSGTMSGFVPTLGTKKWVDQIKANMGLPNTAFWQPWYYKTVNAGDYQEIPGLTLITIRTGFYMFEDQPDLAYHIYDSFVKNTTISA